MNDGPDGRWTRRSTDDAAAVADWIGERPATVIAVSALRAGQARWWIDGDPAAPLATLVEPAILPGELLGVGDGETLMTLLERAEGWWCVELESGTATGLAEPFGRRWGRAPAVPDLVHRLDRPVEVFDHRSVRPLSADEAYRLPLSHPGLLPDRHLAAAAAELGRLVGAVEDGVVVGRASSLAVGTTFADVGVHVDGAHRRQGIATACASLLCRRLQGERLVPVWSTSSTNLASLHTAARLGFVEVDRLTYLVRGDRRPQRPPATSRNAPVT